MKLSTTRISGAVAALPILLVALSGAPGAAAETDCETVIVETSVATLEGTHAGTFVEVGTDSAGRPLFKSEDGMSLQFIETGSVLDDEYSTYVYSQSPDFEPEDNTLEDASDLEVQDPVVEESIRRALNACGYWVIGKTGTGDTAMYPMAKVSDCADHPVMIDIDSEWIFQETHESEQEPLGVRNVVLECGVDQEEGDNAGENAGENAEDDSGAGGVGKVALGFGVTVAAVVASFF